MANRQNKKSVAGHNYDHVKVVASGSAKVNEQVYTSSSNPVNITEIEKRINRIQQQVGQATVESNNPILAKGKRLLRILESH